MKTKRLVLMALFTALCFLGTWLHIPVPIGGATSMVHLGTTMIFIVAILIGKEAAIPAAIGCALFDLLSPGYAVWVIPTLLVKGLTGYVTGKIAFCNGREGRNQVFNIIAFVSGELVSLVGYFGFNWLIFYGWEGAVASVITSSVTTAIGLVIAIPLALAVKTATQRFTKGVFTEA
ncbi:ECF transporter S component [Clostridium vincentii]|uniref:Thiamine transporter HmpT n=1 Tax=Clostridium vincentii TaxID=52704 RepID=A0A2T0BEG9_9CLOT|nr:ECF transporter S component [Clostridium vincentii]PRR82233.1 Thiamine precursor transporter HmpT [Clostridium vincentii]